MWFCGAGLAAGRDLRQRASGTRQPFGVSCRRLFSCAFTRPNSTRSALSPPVSCLCICYHRLSASTVAVVAVVAVVVLYKSTRSRATAFPLWAFCQNSPSRSLFFSRPCSAAPHRLPLSAASFFFLPGRPFFFFLPRQTACRLLLKPSAFFAPPLFPNLQTQVSFSGFSPSTANQHSATPPSASDIVLSSSSSCSFYLCFLALPR